VYRIEVAEGAGTRVGRLVELMAASPDIQARLLEVLLEDARAEQAAFVDFFCSSARLTESLARGGWRDEADLPHPLPTLLRPIVHGRRGIPFLGHVSRPGDAQAMDAWYVTKGDGDQDRPN
jgi:hypothetical protein